MSQPQIPDHIRIRMLEDEVEELRGKLLEILKNGLPPVHLTVKGAEGLALLEGIRVRQGAALPLLAQAWLEMREANAEYHYRISQELLTKVHELLVREGVHLEELRLIGSFERKH